MADEGAGAPVASAATVRVRARQLRAALAATLEDERVARALERKPYFDTALGELELVLGNAIPRFVAFNDQQRLAIEPLVVRSRRDRGPADRLRQDAHILGEHAVAGRRGRARGAVEHCAAEPRRRGRAPRHRDDDAVDGQQRRPRGRRAGRLGGDGRAGGAVAGVHRHPAHPVPRHGAAVQPEAVTAPAALDSLRRAGRSGLVSICALDKSGSCPRVALPTVRSSSRSARCARRARSWR